MEEMHHSLYHRQFKLIKLVFALITALCAGNAKAQRIYISQQNGKQLPVNVVVNRGVAHEFGPKYFMVHAQNDSLAIQLQADSLAQITVSCGDEYREFVYASDQFHLNLGSQGWVLGQPDRLNLQIDSLNLFVNQIITQFTLSGGRSYQPLLLALDSLKNAAQSAQDPFLASYLWYASADLAYISQRFPENQLRSVYFRDHPIEPLHPAWRQSFRTYFEDEGLKRSADADFVEAISRANWVDYRSLFMKDSAVTDLSLANYVGLYAAYRLIFNGQFGPRKMLPLIENALNYADEKEFKAEVEAISSFYRPRLRGNPFPDLSFSLQNSEQPTSISALGNKPKYLLFLPEMNRDTRLIIREAAALEQKYGSDLDFLVLFDHLEEVEHQNLQDTHPRMRFGLLEKTAALRVVRNPGEIQYALLGPDLKCWQFPAEAPETGVEAGMRSLLISNR